jgi:hypothetical protein
MKLLLALVWLAGGAGVLAWQWSTGNAQLDLRVGERTLSAGWLAVFLGGFNTACWWLQRIAPAPMLTTPEPDQLPPPGPEPEPLPQPGVATLSLPLPAEDDLPLVFDAEEPGGFPAPEDSASTFLDEQIMLQDGEDFHVELDEEEAELPGLENGREYLPPLDPKDRGERP